MHSKIIVAIIISLFLHQIHINTFPLIKRSFIQDDSSNDPEESCEEDEDFDDIADVEDSRASINVSRNVLDAVVDGLLSRQVVHNVPLRLLEVSSPENALVSRSCVFGDQVDHIARSLRLVNTG